MFFCEVSSLMYFRWQTLLRVAKRKEKEIQHLFQYLLSCMQYFHIYNISAKAQAYLHGTVRSMFLSQYGLLIAHNNKWQKVEQLVEQS